MEAEAKGRGRGKDEGDADEGGRGRTRQKELQKQQWDSTSPVSTVPFAKGAFFDGPFFHSPATLGFPLFVQSFVCGGRGRIVVVCCCLYVSYVGQGRVQAIPFASLCEGVGQTSSCTQIFH